mgnify:CR=1 FL=1
MQVRRGILPAKHAKGREIETQTFSRYFACLAGQILVVSEGAALAP